MCPHKLLCRTKALVPQSHGCVDDVFTIPTHHHKPGAGERGTCQISVSRSTGSSKKADICKGKGSHAQGNHWNTEHELYICLKCHGTPFPSWVMLLLVSTEHLLDSGSLLFEPVNKKPQPAQEKRWRNVLPSIRVVLDCLRIDFTAAHVLHSQWQPLSIFDFSISHCFQVSLLDFGMFSPNNFSICIHGHGRFFTTKLESKKEVRLWKKIHCWFSFQL